LDDPEKSRNLPETFGGSATISGNPAGTKQPHEMAKKKNLIVGAGAIVILLGILFAFRYGHPHDSVGDRNGMLRLMPEDATAVVYLDLAQLRASPVLPGLFRWATKPTIDSDYAQFLQATGFNYENDLDRLALAIHREPQGPLAFAVADGRFDRKKIEAYASHYGSLKTADGKTLFAVPLNGSNHKAYFTFLKSDRIAWANDSSFFFQRPRSESSTEWREHFSRLAGTPVFAVLRQDSEAAAALARAPGSLHSPELVALLAQLQWISISAKPDGNLLRVGIEGECLTESTEHQLKEMLSGLVVLAQMGLNDPKTRKQLDPGVREGYLELLQSADIQQLDRGTSKSVRVIFEVSPKLLEAAESSTAGADPVQTGH
jgi:hypothetical protein